MREAIPSRHGLARPATHRDGSDRTYIRFYLLAHPGERGPFDLGDLLDESWRGDTLEVTDDGELVRCPHSGIVMERHGVTFTIREVDLASWEVAAQEISRLRRVLVRVYDRDPAAAADQRSRLAADRAEPIWSAHDRGLSPARIVDELAEADESDAEYPIDERQVRRVLRRGRRIGDTFVRSEQPNP